MSTKRWMTMSDGWLAVCCFVVGCIVVVCANLAVAALTAPVECRPVGTMTAGPPVVRELP